MQNVIWFLDDGVKSKVTLHYLFPFKRFPGNFCDTNFSKFQCYMKSTVSVCFFILGINFFKGKTGR